MTDRMDDDMIPIADAADMIGVPVSTARGWVVRGVIVGAARHGPRGRLSVPRGEVVRILEEREAKGHRQRASAWVPMTERREERYS